MNEKEPTVLTREIVYKSGNMPVRLTGSLVKRYLVSGQANLISDQELIMFMKMCEGLRLNPFLRDAHLIKFSERDPATMVVGKDAFTKRAASLPECGGWNAGILVKKKVGAKEVISRRIGSSLMEGEELVGGWARAIHKGWTESLEIEVSLKEYMRFNKAGEPTRAWAGMPATMIRKVALVQALREAFPNTFGGIYTEEELPLDSDQLPQKPVELNDDDLKAAEKAWEEEKEEPAPAPAKQSIELKEEPPKNGKPPKEGQPEIF